MDCWFDDFFDPAFFDVCGAAPPITGGWSNYPVDIIDWTRAHEIEQALREDEEILLLL
jgi:hypothetical protein